MGGLQLDMKISIILPDLCGGGAERLHINLATYWNNNGHIVEFFLMKNQGELLTLVDKNIKIQYNLIML